MDLEVIKSTLTDERLGRIETVLDNRTRSIVTVLENISDLGNVMAVMRSAESMGYFQMNLIETPGKERIRTSNRSSLGCEKWLELKRYPESNTCLNALKAAGYKIAVSDLNATHSLGTLPIDDKLAIVFGSEKWGVSDAAKEAADYTFRIPMYGFSQSYNISVAAALTLQSLTERRIQKFGKQGDLSESEKSLLRETYLRVAVPYSEYL